MGLVATLRGAMVSAIAAADDAVTEITYVQLTLGTYDPATDSRTDTEGLTTFSTFVYSLKDSEVDWFAGDVSMQKVIVNFDDLGFAPSAEDIVRIGGVDWEIMKIKTFPGNVGYILFIRVT